MNAIVRQFTICVVLLWGFMQPSPAQGQNSRRHHESGIVGFVEGGGTWEIAVETSTGEPVTFLETDEDGFFMVVLEPGEYVLTPYYIPQPGLGGVTPNYIIMGPATTVKVEKNHFTFVVLPTTLGHGLFPIPQGRSNDTRRTSQWSEPVLRPAVSHHL